MKWWQADDAEGSLAQALGHVNHARDLVDQSSVVRCEQRFKALNCLWNAHGRCQNDERGDTSLFIELLRSCDEPGKEALLRTPATSQLVNLFPSVMNHDVLRKKQHRPGSRIPRDLEEKATEKHRDLEAHYEQWLSGTRKLDSVAKTLAELLYVVRSNIAHGEKTPYGPDLEKTRRDEHVSAVVEPLLDGLIDDLLDKPSGKLVVYGTLQPGAPNHSVLAGVEGEWTDCRVRGLLSTSIERLPEFRWIIHEELVSAKLLRAPDLRERWSRLDAFEGSTYRRHLVVVEEGNCERWRTAMSAHGAHRTCFCAQVDCRRRGPNADTESTVREVWDQRVHSGEYLGIDLLLNLRAGKSRPVVALRGQRLLRQAFRGRTRSLRGCRGAMSSC